MTQIALSIEREGQPRERYSERIAGLLSPVQGGSPRVVDLFAGCGGLALGFEAQGFETVGFEMDADACATYNQNLAGRWEFLPRHERLTQLLSGSSAGIVFVTAFADRKAFRKWVRDIAWRTEVWIADEPGHLIHFDGERFLGPYAS